MGMKLSYFVDYVLRDRLRNQHYVPVGVWVQGPGPGLDIVMEYLPGNVEVAKDAEWTINRLVEAGFRTLPDDFLEYHQARISPYRGMRGPIIETEEYDSAEACARAILDRLNQRTRSRATRSN